MITIVDFQPKLFGGMVDCYRAGFPNGHNRYSLARLARFQRDSIVLAVDSRQTVTGVLIGITSARDAWFTGLTVLPEQPHPRQLIAQLASRVSHRFQELGYAEAKLTTARKGVLRFTQRLGATRIEEVPNCFFDQYSRWLITVTAEQLPSLVQLAVQ